MSYPKPLSERTLKRMYAESGLSEKQLEFLRRFFGSCTNLYGFLNAVQDMHNHQHLWSNRGWTPEELFHQRPKCGMPSICFGPGIPKSFADGTIDKDELIREIKKMGIDVAE